MKIEIKIPDIAENVESGYVASILVSKGDQVEKDQPVIEVETDKAATDIPSTHAGTVEEIRVSEGDEVKVGQVVLVLEDHNESKAKSQKSKEKEEPEEESNDKSRKSKVGEEPGEEQEEEEEEESKVQSPKSEEEPEEESGRVAKKEAGRALGANIPASPAVRRKAREAGIDLSKVKGSGPGGRITYGDLEEREEKPREQAAKGKEPELPDFSQWGRVTREPMTRIRKLTAERMSGSWSQVPHVTQFDEADMTDMEAFRQGYAGSIEKMGGKLTVTAILLKITSFALQRFPRFNSSLDMEAEEIIYKHYYNIGIAVDTDRGLMVPVIREVDRKSLVKLSRELSDVAEKARNKKISPDDLQGGNFSISNLGGIGGTAFTPIVYTPQVAVLGVSRAQYRQIYRNDTFEKRLVLPLSLSYDHRVIDGAEGARFLRWICDFLEDPYAILK